MGTNEDISANQEGLITDSDELVKPLLEKDFELIQDQASTEHTVSFLAQTIKDLPGEGVKVICIAGGAASGKSTLSDSLVKTLNGIGLSADATATDDFVKGDRTWRWENIEGKADSDPTDKYDFALLNEKINAIRSNTDPSQAIAVPTYDQATGLAISAGEENYTHQIGKVNVLVVVEDFDAVDNPELIVYLHVADNQRLQNRIARDVVHRGGDPAKTTDNFNFRHTSQHLPHTLPIIKKASYVIDANTDNDQWQFNIYKANSYI